MVRSLLVILLWLALLFVVLLAIVNNPARNTPGAWSLSVGAPSVPASGGAGFSSVLGRPSLSAAFINRVLAAYRSPAVGLGQTLYQQSLTFGIDDAYALAFFQHESSFGTAGVARVTHSLGNIRCTAGWSCYAGYRSYATWQAGARDWFQLISSVYVARGLITLERIVPVYAPSSDHNNVDGYITAVRSAVAAWRAGRLSV